MGHTLKIWNEFGIKCKTSFHAAGLDFFVPRLNGMTLDKKRAAYFAFQKSFDISEVDMGKLCNEAKRILIEKIGDPVRADENSLDTVHLFLALDSVMTRNKHNTMLEKLEDFCGHRLVYDKKEDKVGLWLDFGDQLKINSGIHEVLPLNYAGVFLNKSGKGNEGFDVRSQVVDDDYVGCVHLSISFTKNKKSPMVWCGDKIIQQLILPIWQVSDIDELSKDNYMELMKDSERGENGFGSQDNKK